VRDVKAPADSKDAIAAVKVEKEESVLKLETNVLRNLQSMSLTPAKHPIRRAGIHASLLQCSRCSTVNGRGPNEKTSCLLADSPNVCRLIHYGLHNALPYLVMELLGENLSELRRKQKGTRFSLSTTVLIGKQVREAARGPAKP
jgi:hypothetical protein